MSRPRPRPFSIAGTKFVACPDCMVIYAATLAECPRCPSVRPSLLRVREAVLKLRRTKKASETPNEDAA